MPDYSEYIEITNRQVEYRNHYRGDYTFKCDILWGESEARRIIKNQTIGEFKRDTPFSRIIINNDTKQIFIDIGIEEHKNGAGIIKTELYIEMIRTEWPNWKIERFKSGYSDVVRYLKDYDVDIGKYYESIKEQIPNYEKFAWDEPKGTLVSVTVGNKTEFQLIERNISEVLSDGDKILKSKFQNNIPPNRIPFGGIHFNTEESSIKLWYSLDSTNMEKWAKKYWANWTITNGELNCKTHYNLIGLSDQYNRAISFLRNQAFLELKNEIMNTDKEPCIEENTYQFNTRQMKKEVMANRFEKMIQKIDYA